MARQSRHPFLVCAGCYKRMPLPAPSPQRTSIDPPLWPTGTWSATVLHLECGHLSVYTVQNLRGRGQAQTVDPSLSDRKHSPEVRPHEWRRVRLSCAEPQCKAQTIVFVYALSPTTAQNVTTKIFEQPTVWRCPAGHTVPYGKAEQEEAFSLEAQSARMSL
jgi:hypothetical protein